VRFPVQYAMALLNGGVSDGLGKMAFPGAARPRNIMPIV
jgi:hypothetical protein